MPVFDNCIIQAPDGVVLSRCGMKKVKWYVSRGLAEIVEGSDPLAIRLKFEPRGRDGLNDPLLTSGKPNKCVVCGSKKKLTKHHIVPYSFIKHMDIKKKVDVIHDIYPLCEKHHTEYEKLSMERRKEMADEFGVPLYGLEPELLKIISRAIKSATALIKYGESIPEERKGSLLSDVQLFLEIEREPTLQELEYASTYKIKEHDDYVNFSQFVANQYDDLEVFAEEWRRHFIETMNPRYMPEIWSVDRGFGATWIPSRFLDQV